MVVPFYSIRGVVKIGSLSPDRFRVGKIDPLSGRLENIAGFELTEVSSRGINIKAV